MKTGKTWGETLLMPMPNPIKHVCLSAPRIYLSILENVDVKTIKKIVGEDRAYLANVVKEIILQVWLLY